MSYVLCTQCCHCLWVVYSWLSLLFSLTFIYYLRYVLCLVYSMLPVSLGCLFLIFPSGFSNVYLVPTVCPMSCVLNVVIVSGLFILDCPFMDSLTFIYYLRYVLCLVYPMLPLFLGCLLLIFPSGFSNVYLLPTVCPMSCVLNVAIVSGLSILDCLFCFL